MREAVGIKIRVVTNIVIVIVMTMIMIIRRTEGTEEQGVSDPEHPSLLAS